MSSPAVRKGRGSFRKATSVSVNITLTPMRSATDTSSTRRQQMRVYITLLPVAPGLESALRTPYRQPHTRITNPLVDASSTPSRLGPHRPWPGVGAAM
eukprot:7550438-Pyramimonas_sp.AAC.1